MSSEGGHTALKRHDSVVLGCLIVGVSALSVLRLLLELGFAPKGSLVYQGVPFEYFISAVFLMILPARFEARRAGTVDHRLRITLYEWWISILGMGAIAALLLAFHQEGLIRTMSVAYWLACGSVVAIFVSASTIPRDHGLTFGMVIADWTMFLSRATTMLCTAAALVLLVVGPRSSEVPASGRAFARWYERQPRLPMAAEWQRAPVTLVEFIDYQCPVCRSAAAQYQKILQEASSKYGKQFAFIEVDFPLENECNDLWGRFGKRGGLHPAACEAAAAVLLARREHPTMERDVVEWMWTNQRTLDTDQVFEGVKAQFGFDVRMRYLELLPAIVRSVQQGRSLEVSATPTFFLNGRRLPFLRPEIMARALEVEMQLTAATRVANAN